MVECGPDACILGAVCVMTESCCNEVDYDCVTVPEHCAGQSGNALAECLCFDTAVGHDPETGLVTCQNFGCTTSCQGDETPQTDTGLDSFPCGELACNAGTLCVETDTCCGGTEHECKPMGECEGMTGTRLAECVCPGTAIAYDHDASTVFCQSCDGTTGCPADSGGTDTASDGTATGATTSGSQETGAL